MSDHTKELIKFNTEIIKILVLLFIATGGGVATLILKGGLNGRETVLVAGGMITAIITMIVAVNIYLNTKQLLR